MDVDRQQALPLLQDLATSVDGVLWAAVHRDTGPYLLLRSGARAALYALEMGSDGVVRVVPIGDATAGAITVSADEALPDPVVTAAPAGWPPRRGYAAGSQG